MASLRTFRLSHPPDHAGPITAEPLPDHRKVYLDYEGEVSDGRGTVVRWDCGEYELVAETAQRIEVRLWGERLAGTAVLEKSAEDLWAFAFSKN